MPSAEGTTMSYLMRLRKTELERDRTGESDAKGIDESQKADSKMSTRCNSPAESFLKVHLPFKFSRLI